MTTIMHTIKRREIYYFNYRLSDSFYRKSLKTDSPKQCRAYVSGIITFLKRRKIVDMTEKKEIDQFIEMLICNKVNELVRLGKSITNPLSPTAKTYFNRWCSLTDSARLHNWHIDHDVCGYGDISMNYPQRRQYRPHNRWLSDNIKATANSTPIASQYIENFEDSPFMDYFQFPSNEGEHFTYLNDQVSAHGQRIATACENNDAQLVRSEIDELKRRFSSLVPTELPKPIKTEQPPTSPLYKNLREEYLQRNITKGVTSDTQKKRKRAYDNFLIELGDLPVADITFEHLEDVWRVLLNIPKSVATKNLPYFKDDNSYRARWEAIQSEDLDPQQFDISNLPSDTLIRYHSTFLKDFFHYCKAKDYIIKNPFTYAHLKRVPERKTPRSSFPLKDVNNLINWATNNLDHKCGWIIVLMAYHGCRNNEIISLTKSQIVCSEHNIYYINITDGKTDAAIRKVPLHKEVINLGFLEYVDSCEGKLFTCKQPEATTFYYNTLRTELGIPPKTVDGGLLSLYSLRHNVISQLGEVSNEHKYRLIGHSTGQIVTSIYTHLDLIQAQMLINKIKYKYI